MWVVKLGGSLAGEAQLLGWLRALSPLPVVIVPGGGPFADSVRQAQARWHFGDQTAHDMAILAMQQYGHMLADLGGHLPTFSRIHASCQPSGNATVWLPCPADLKAIPPSWDITSDSLAAWLAGKLDATDLLLVKATLRGSRNEWGYEATTDMALLKLNGLIDAAFPEYARSIRSRCWLGGIDQYLNLAASLTVPEPVFLRATAG
jgi:aspartokinase-like uncharacterized kinase